MYTTKEVAERLKISTSQVLRLFHAGSLPYVKLSERCFRVREQDLDEFIKENVECTL